MLILKRKSIEIQRTSDSAKPTVVSGHRFPGGSPLYTMSLK
ncbi:hypothetical protein M7I_1071 [Glarea lozoyensis 74030]|uniref:Uncharacterized protein n=1 Tax=Glarea lozoyensis (strain ATCC 74030 / MF5533) TaxID=1104152 RepID=H0EF33_GLAL7|nr:hypothetical protein M7I_1071 [Glarea lozoyensis 74030]